jgi:hypothetical protein
MQLDEVKNLIDSAAGKVSPASLLVEGVTESSGIYIWYEPGSILPSYIGKATGKYGLRNRILRQHLNPKYLEVRQERWTSEDKTQSIHGVMHNGRLAIEKSAFRKNLARKLGHAPGEKNIRFILDRFELRLIPLPTLTSVEIARIESELIPYYRPQLNRAGLNRGGDLVS